jgi:hypothetical protein
MMKPEKYYKGLTRKNRQARQKEIAKFGAMNWKDPRAYVGFRTDRGVRTRKSSYTEQWFRLFPNARSLKEKAAASGVPLQYLQAVYNRGMAAWRTGHRPGATQQQWGYARVHSFLVKGKTFWTTDADLAAAARQASATARRWFS